MSRSWAISRPDQTSIWQGRFDAFYWTSTSARSSRPVDAEALQGWGPAEWWGLSPASVRVRLPGILMLVATILFRGRAQTVVMVRLRPPIRIRSRASYARRSPRRRWAGSRSPSRGACWRRTRSRGFPGRQARRQGHRDSVCLALVFVLAGGAWSVDPAGSRARKAPREAVDGVRSVLRGARIFAL